MISRVYEQASMSESVDTVIVATDDQRIFDHVSAFGGRAIMTDVGHVNGTGRVAEAATHFPDATIVVNVQGDEPFIDPADIDRLCHTFRDPLVDVATLAHPITDERSLLSPNVVKVVRSKEGRALYFSRHAIPYLRDVPVGRWIDEKAHFQHVGLYAYRAVVLQRLVQLPPDDLEAAESLEQLRWIGAGVSIQVEMARQLAMGIDTAEDLASAESYLRKQNK